METIYKVITITLLIALATGYIIWLRGYQNHINTCEINIENQTCTKPTAIILSS